MLTFNLMAYFTCANDKAITLDIICKYYLGNTITLTSVIITALIEPALLIDLQAQAIAN